MTANLDALLPGALVLLDAESPRLGFERGDRATIIRGEQDRYFTVEIHRTGQRLAFSPTELILVPLEHAQPYRCCIHCSCPAAADGHPEPCTKCAQPLVRSADQDAARAMAAGE